MPKTNQMKWFVMCTWFVVRVCVCMLVFKIGFYTFIILVIEGDGDRTNNGNVNFMQNLIDPKQFQTKPQILSICDQWLAKSLCVCMCGFIYC